MGTAESLLYYDEGEGRDVQGDAAEGGIGSSGSSASNQPAPLHRAPSSSAGSTSAGPPPPSSSSSIPPAKEQNTSGPSSSRQRRGVGPAQRQNNDGNKNEQSPPLILRGYVIGSSSTGKTSLVRRLRGENPFAEDADVAGAAAGGGGEEQQQQQQHRKRRPQRKRKMMALVPWRDRQSGQNCQLHVVEKTSDAAQTADDVAMEALGDRPDFCICMVDPRSESSVKFAETAIDALLNAPLDDRPSSRTTTNTNTSNKNNLTPLTRPNICVLINYMDLIKIVDDEEKMGGDNDDGLYRVSQSWLMDICAEIIALQTNENAGNDDPRTTIGPSIQIYPSSMVSCSGLTSLHSFIMLPYMRKKEVRLLKQLEQLHRSHDKSMTELRDGGVKAMQQAINEGKARMSTAPPVSSGRRSIIQLQKGRGNAGASSKSAAPGSEKRVRIDETRNTDHFEEDEPPLPPKSTSSVRHDDVDKMTQKLQEADQARRRRRRQALVGEESTSEDGTAARPSARQESSSSGRRSIISSKQRDAMQDAISKVPTPLQQKQQKKQINNIAADPMKALEDFLGSDSDSDVGGDPIHSTVRRAAKDGKNDNDDSSSDGSRSDTDGDDEGPRPSILLSDSDSEDDDFYYDEGGHAHYSHLDDRRKMPSAEEQVDENPATEEVESVEEVSVANGNVETPPKRRDSKTLRSNHDEEEKKDESPSGRSAADEEASSDPSSSVDEEAAGDGVDVGGDSIKEGSNQEILHSNDESSVSTPIVDSKPSDESSELDSEDESVVDGAELARPEILHSDDEDSVGGKQSAEGVGILHSEHDDDNNNAETDATKQAAVEILHSDDEGSNRKLSNGIESPDNEVQVLDSEDESTPSAAEQSTHILHSDDNNDDDDDVKPPSPVPLPDRTPVANDFGDENESSRVEILHSDEEDDDDEVPRKPKEPVVSASIDIDEEEDQQTKGGEQAAPSIDDALDSEPHVGSSSSNVLVEALQPNDTDDEPEGEPEARPEEPASTGMSAAVAAALAAAEEEARRMMQATVVASDVVEERRKKKKKSKDGRKSKKPSKSADGEGKKTKKKKKSRASSVNYS